MSRFDFHQHAACAGQPTAIFYSDDHTTNTRAAKQLCQQCSIRQRCLEDAIERREEFGVWGGLTASERVAERKRRGLPTGPYGLRYSESVRNDRRIRETNQLAMEVGA